VSTSVEGLGGGGLAQAQPDAQRAARGARDVQRQEARHGLGDRRGLGRRVVLRVRRRRLGSEFEGDRAQRAGHLRGEREVELGDDARAPEVAAGDPLAERCGRLAHAEPRGAQGRAVREEEPLVAELGHEPRAGRERLERVRRKALEVVHDGVQRQRARRIEVDLRDIALRRGTSERPAGVVIDVQRDAEGLRERQLAVAVAAAGETRRDPAGEERGEQGAARALENARAAPRPPTPVSLHFDPAPGDAGS
jgi:hypothetical protein